MRLGCLVILFLWISHLAIGQDERFMRELYKDDKKVLETEKAFRKINWHVKSPGYRYDLNSDGKREIIQIEKKDSEDWITIKDHKKKIVFSKKFNRSGRESRVMSILFAQLDRQVKVLIVRYYEGFVKYTEFKGRGQLYFITIENNQLEKMYFQAGPRFWTEQEKVGDHYHQRNYQLLVKDYNRDGSRDIGVHYDKISSIWFYERKGFWKNL